MQVRFGHRHISSASCWKSSSLKCRVVLPQDISSLPCNEEFDLIPEGFLHKSCWLPYFMPPCLEHDTLALILLLICCLFVLFLSGLSTPPSGNHCPFPIIFPHSTSVFETPSSEKGNSTVGGYLLGVPSLKTRLHIHICQTRAV